VGGESLFKTWGWRVENAGLSAAFAAEDSCEPVENQERSAAGAASLSYSYGTLCTSNCDLKLPDVSVFGNLGRPVDRQGTCTLQHNEYLGPKKRFNLIQCWSIWLTRTVDLPS